MGSLRTIAYKTCPNRLWAKFYGPPLPDGQGRVWVDHSQHDMYGHHFDVVTDSGVNDIYYGHNQSMGIRTYYFSFFNQYAPEGPTDKPEAIQEYRGKFLALACSIAEKLGGGLCGKHQLRVCFGSGANWAAILADLATYGQGWA